MSLTTSVQYFIRCKTFKLYKKEFPKPLYFWPYERFNHILHRVLYPIYKQHYGCYWSWSLHLYLFICQGEVVINCIWATIFRIIDNRSSLVSTYKTTVTTQLCKQKKIRQKIHTKYLVTKICCFSRKTLKQSLLFSTKRGCWINHKLVSENEISKIQPCLGLASEIQLQKIISRIYYF